MAAYDFVIKQGDTLPTLQQTLQDTTGAAVNLTGCTVKFVMRSLVSATPVINATATITDAANGKVTYAFSATDTTTAGTFMGTWTITNGSGQVFTVPTDGYLTIRIEQNLTTTGGNQLVSLAEVKDYLTIPASDKTRDAKLVQMANDLIPVVEHITGPIIQRVVEEWHDGGQASIILRKRPVANVIAISEYIGPVEWTLALVPDPNKGTMYSAKFEPPARIVRRGPGGSTFPFAAGLQTVHVTYVAGRTSVPDNVRLGTLELIRINFSQTQARPLMRGWPTDGSADDIEPGRELLGFFVPNRVRELLAPTRKAPGIA